MSEIQLHELPEWRERCFAQATGMIGNLQHDQVPAVAAVRGVRDATAWLGWRPEPLDSAYPSVSLTTGDELILDFGAHRVGYLTLTLRAVGTEPYHAPLRLELYFAELFGEVAVPQPDTAVWRGLLAESWLPEEVIQIDEFPVAVQVPRRHAFRYLRVKVRAFSGTVRIDQAVVNEESAVLKWQVPPPAAALDDELRRIDQVGVATLRHCMQRVFEDGPKRDRRLWGGDLRLQALVNAVSFRHFELVERSLYLLAAGIDTDGMIPGCVFDRPSGIRGNKTVTYALLFGVMLEEHLAFSGRTACVKELFPLSLHQLALVRRWLDERGRFPDRIPHWAFVDHAPELEETAAFTGIFMTSLDAHARLAAQLAMPELAAELQGELCRMRENARRDFYDAAAQLAVCNGQYSYASQIWLTLGGVFAPAEAQVALTRIAERPDALRPRTPYLWHYMLEAYFKCGMAAEAWQLIRSYWGGMVRNGADTFWEAYVPEEDHFSPYADFRLNSACHAWSCTPSYFIRQLKA